MKLLCVISRVLTKLIYYCSRVGEGAGDCVSMSQCRCEGHRTTLSCQILLLPLHRFQGSNLGHQVWVTTTFTH